MSTAHSRTKPSGKMLSKLSLISTLCAAVLLPCAYAQEETDIPSPQVSTSKDVQLSLPNLQVYHHRDDLQYHLPKEQLSLVTITLNEQEIDIPIVKYNARQAINKGVAIIIGDIHPQGYIDSNLHTLAKTLPDWGWHTILVSPSPSYLHVSQTTLSTSDTQKSNDDSTQNTDAVANNTAPTSPQTGIAAISLQAPSLNYTNDEYLAFLASLTQALNTRFSQQPGYKFIYAKGKSAAGLISLFSSSSSEQFDAIVLENIYWTSQEKNTQIAQQLSSLSMPVLDLVNKTDNQWAQHTKKLRADEVRINLKPMYRQLDVSGTSLGQSQQYSLAKEVVSWTHYLGW